MAFGILGGFKSSFLIWRQVRQVDNLPTSKARSAAVGLAEFAGSARPLDARSPQTIESDNRHEERILLQRVKKQASPGEDDSSDKYIGDPFYLVDETGRILVDPSGAEFWEGASIPFWEPVRKIFLSPKENTRPDPNSPNLIPALTSGDRVYLIGSVEINENAPATAKDSERLVVRPSSRKVRTSFIRKLLWSDEDEEPGQDIQDIFFLSNTTERSARHVLLRGIRQVALLSVLWSTSSLWLFLHSAPI